MASFNAADHVDVAHRRHIQDHTGNSNEIHYWGYPSRVVPCTNDPGSCAYLDGVYWMHTVSMLYSFIMWAVIGGILLILVFLRVFRPHRDITGSESRKQGFFYRVFRSVAAASRQYLLPESFGKVFPYTTRLQALVLATICVYLTIFSFVGIVYKTWVTPVKNSDKFNTRTGLGGFSDRIGVLAYALTPLTIALCSRDSILSLLTGVPYQNFNFLHRWTGRIILVQSFVHTIGWTIIEGKLYQPQPKVYNEWIVQTYMVWGIVAQGFITFLFVFSLSSVIRWTGYEFFRKSHLIVGGLYLGACWGHWSKLACWMIASLGLLGIDLGLRGLRICLIHFGYKDGNRGLGFRNIKSKVELFKDPSGTIVRMSFTHNHQPWNIGEHFYLTFPALSIWQSHPFTPTSVPPTALVPPTHTYIIRARNGETGKLAALADVAATDKNSHIETPVIVLGPYGRSVIDEEVSNVLAISGGTGVSFTLPVVQAILENPTSITENIEFIWIVRHVENLAWIGSELKTLKSYLSRSSSSAIEETKQGQTFVRSVDQKRLRIKIFVSRAPETRTHFHAQIGREKDLEISSASSSNSATVHTHELQELLQPHPDFSVTYLDHMRPSVKAMVDSFLDDTVSSGRIQVVASGPAGLGTDTRTAVAARNSASAVWSGDEKSDVALVWDDRIG